MMIETMTTDLLILLFASFVASWIGSTLMRHYAIARAMLDVPNKRSSHTVPTPRGGGVAFVFSFLIGLLAFRLLGYVDPLLRIALALGGGIVALVGFRDDRRPLSIKVKLTWHFIAAAIALVSLRGWPALDPGYLDLNSIFGALGSLPLLVWGINLYNFMDGIDGLAVSEAIFLALGSSVIIVMAGGSALESLLLAAVCLGFAFLNWPPARLFMGDAGSGFLGFTFTVIGLDSVFAMETTVWPWLILPAVFIIDASYTLLWRILTGQRWYEAHRSHAYQHAAQRMNSHRAVTLGTQCINVCWLLPLACVAQHWPASGLAVTVIAWAPLLLLTLYLEAGVIGAEKVLTLPTRRSQGGAANAKIDVPLAAGLDKRAMR